MKKNLLLLLLLIIPTLGISQSWYDLYTQSKKQYEEKKYREAVNNLIAARIQAQQDYGQDHANYKNTIRLLAQVYFTVRDYRNSITNYKAIEKILKDARAIKTEENIEVLEEMANVFLAAKRMPNAAQYYQKSLDIRAVVPGKGEKTRGYITTLHNLASLYYKGKIWSKAESNFERLNTLAKTSYKARGKIYLGIIQETAEMYFDASKWQKSLDYYNLHIKVNIYSKISRKNYITSYERVAECYHKLSNKEKTVASYNTYLKYKSYIVGKNDTTYHHEMDNVVEIYRGVKDYAASKTLLTKKLGILRIKPGTNSAVFATTTLNLATDFETLKNYVQAEKLIKQAVEIIKKVETEKSEDYSDALDRLAKLKVETQKLEEAEKLFIEAQGLRKEHLGKEHSNYTNGLDTLAYFYINQKKYTEAAILVTENLAIRVKKPGKRHPDYAAALITKSDLLVAQKKYKDAEVIIKEIGRIHTSYFGSTTKPTALNIKRLADLYKAMEKYPLALKSYRQALTLLEMTMGKKKCLPCEDVKASIQLVNDAEKDKK